MGGRRFSPGNALTHSPRMLHPCSIDPRHHCFEKCIGTKFSMVKLDLQIVICGWTKKSLQRGMS